MSRSPALKWVGLALLGVAIAVAVAIAASHLASQQIGISSESIRAGDALVPSSAREHRDRHGEHHGKGEHPTTRPEETTPPPREETQPETTSTEPTTTPETSVPPEPNSDGGDDHGSGGHGADD